MTQREMYNTIKNIITGISVEDFEALAPAFSREEIVEGIDARIEALNKKSAGSKKPTKTLCKALPKSLTRATSRVRARSSSAKKTRTSTKSFPSSLRRAISKWAIPLTWWRLPTASPSS